MKRRFQHTHPGQKRVYSLVGRSLQTTATAAAAATATRRGLFGHGADSGRPAVLRPRPMNRAGAGVVRWAKPPTVVAGSVCAEQVGRGDPGQPPDRHRQSRPHQDGCGECGQQWGAGDREEVTVQHALTE